jgi:hypothetical protein
LLNLQFKTKLNGFFGASALTQTVVGKIKQTSELKKTIQLKAQNQPNN